MIRHDDGSPAGPTAVHDHESAVVARLDALATQLEGDPDPEFRARARARLVAMAAVRTPEPAPAPLRNRLLAARAVDRPPSRWRGRMTAGLAGAAVAVTGLAALVAVASGAQPGDPLYDLKRGTEQTQLALAGDSRGQTLLELAGTRLEELERLTGDGEAALVRRTLQTMDAQTTEGAALLTGHAVRTGDAQPLDALARWTAEQSAQLGAIGAGVPEDASPAYAQSVDLLEAVGARAAGLRTAFECSSGLATAGDDELGPLPGLCPADVPPAAEEPPAPVVPDPGTVTGPATPPSADPALPAPPPVAPGGPPGTPPVPEGDDGPPGGAAPTPVQPPAQGGGALLPPVPSLPLPGTPDATTGRPAPPPAIAVPLPGPIRICLPPLRIGKC